MKRAALVLCVLLMVLPCIARAEPGAPVYALVVKDQQNPYMQKMYDGFAEACGELGAIPLLAGPGGTDAQSQAEIIDQLTEQWVDALAIAVSDEQSATEPLQRALEAGIRVISVDSATAPGSRLTHIQQADPVVLGRAMMQAAHRMISGQGQLAILSTTETMPNQATWVKLMLSELEDHPDVYKNMQLVEVAYGGDERELSQQETARLLDSYPDLKILIAPTTVGLNAAASVIAERGSGVLVTGLGLPSDMEPYIQSGVCPWMYLWNPIDMGYLAAHALSALHLDQAQGTLDQTFSAGRLGEKIITQSLDGGTEVVVGNPYKFDQGNILSWKGVF